MLSQKIGKLNNLNIFASK